MSESLFALQSMLQPILNEAIAQIQNAHSSAELEKVRVEFLGKQGKVTNLMHKISNLDTESKKTFGAQVNNIKSQISEQVDIKQKHLRNLEIDQQIKSEKQDVTISSRNQILGTIHPITKTIAELVAIFQSMDFKVVQGPNIEDEWHNFTGLNMGEHHPARQMHDTFYMPNGQLLRTHTSPVQLRAMQHTTPPFKIIAPGRVYRADDHDQTHAPMFHQLEVLAVGYDLNMGHLKRITMDFLEAFFQSNKFNIRMRPSFFPFTEPSTEIDIMFNDSGKWLEIMGGGMVHRKVLENVGINPSIYSGFAIGMGIERMTMLKYGINDLRPLYASDIRWLKHYGLSPFDTFSVH